MDRWTGNARAALMYMYMYRVASFTDTILVKVVTL